MANSVMFIEGYYVLITMAFLFFIVHKGAPVFEAFFIILVITSPYSISIIPFRQDTLDTYNIYTNKDVLNFINFYKIFGLSILDYFSLIILIKNISLFNRIPTFFKLFFSMILLFSIVSYAISSIVMWSVQLDNITRVMSAVKTICYIFALYFCIIRICDKINIIIFFGILSKLIIIYFVGMALLLTQLPSWYTWVKYSVHYKFLDQTDQFLVFLLISMAFFTPLKEGVQYKIYSIVATVFILISGGKAFVYTLLLLFLGWAFKIKKIKVFSLFILFYVAMILSWSISYVIGWWGGDLSIYTRYFQINQLLLNYSEHPVLLLSGVGLGKAYYFFSEQAVFDPGAYVGEEVFSKFKLGFQMPYLLWLKNYGLFGIGILVILFVYTHNNIIKNKKTISAFVFLLSLYFILICGMDFPSFGLKTLIPVAIYMYLYNEKGYPNSVGENS